MPILFFLSLAFAEVTTTESQSVDLSNQKSNPIYQDITCILSINSEVIDSSEKSSFSFYHQGQLSVSEIHQRIDQIDDNPFPVGAVGCFTTVLPHQIIDLFSNIEQTLQEVCASELLGSSDKNIHAKFSALTPDAQKSCRIKIQQSFLIQRQ